MATDRIKLGGLWVNRSKDGREYLTGKLSPTVKILIFKNDFKTTDNQPSHVMYLAPVETDETQRSNTPAPSSFFGGADDRDSGDSGDRPADDDFPSEAEAAPPPNARASQPGNRSGDRSAAGPGQGNRSAPQGQGQAPRQNGNNRPSTPAPNRPSAPAPARDESAMDDMTDPFDE